MTKESTHTRYNLHWWLRTCKRFATGVSKPHPASDLPQGFRSHIEESKSVYRSSPTCQKNLNKMTKESTHTRYNLHWWLRTCKRFATGFRSHIEVSKSVYRSSPTCQKNLNKMTKESTHTRYNLHWWLRTCKRFATGVSKPHRGI
jgi:uncharacterized protein (UPF0128 family)